jgi:hypothetical protein
VYVGRRAESEHLRAALMRGSAAAVWGLGGLGKTALVLHAIHQHFPAREGDALFVRVPQDERAPFASAEVFRALLATSGEPNAERFSRAATPQLRIASALELAEDRTRWVVVDDAHHGDERDLADLIDAVTKYARRSRWVFTSRVAPANLPREQVVLLEAMAREDLVALALACVPGLASEKAESLAAAAQGSPWNLRNRVAGPHAREEDSLLASLSDDEAAAVESLSVLHVAVPRELLGRVAPRIDRGALEKLAGRAFFEETPEGVCAHDVARPLVLARAGARGREVSERVARALGAVPAERLPAAIALDLVRLLLSLGETRRALELVDISYPRFRSDGYLGTLMAHLVPAADSSRGELLRLRCAVDSRDPRLLADLHPPRSRDAEARLLWAWALFWRGLLGEAAELAAQLRADAAPDVAFEAALLAARCAIFVGDVAKANLDAARPRTPEQHMARDLVQALTLVRASQFEAGLELAQRVSGSLTGRESVPSEIREQLAEIFLRLGRNFDAHRTLQIEGVSHPFSPSLAEVLQRTTIAVQSGALQDARALLARFAVFAEASPLLRAHLRRLTIRLRLTAGGFAGLEDEITRLEAESTGVGTGDGYSSARSYRWVLASSLGEERIAEPARPFALRSSTQELGIDVARAAHEARRGGRVLPQDDGFPSIEPRIIMAIGASVDALLHGDPAAAMRLASSACAWSREHGWALHLGEAHWQLAEIALVYDKDDVLENAVSALAELGEAFPSPRFACEARLLASVGARAPFDPSVLARIAREEDVSPAAARQAQALLGDDPRLDDVDRLVLGAVRRRAGGLHVERVGAGTGPGAGAWGLDETRMSAWTEDGRAVSFASTPMLWNVVKAIADRGGSASKGDLATSVWGVRDYHPLRDDKRLQVAVRKVRMLLEENPSAPTRLITTADGYALGGGDVRRLRRA